LTDFSLKVNLVSNLDWTKRSAKETNTKTNNCLVIIALLTACNLLPICRRLWLLYLEAVLRLYLLRQVISQNDLKSLNHLVYSKIWTIKCPLTRRDLIIAAVSDLFIRLETNYWRSHPRPDNALFDAE
jgi:hypothetical protein